MITTVLLLTGIGFAIAMLIYFTNIFVPNRVKRLERAQEVSEILPGLNCGACGRPSCFAFARELTEPQALSCCGNGTDDDILSKSPCAILLSDPEGVKKLEDALDIKLDLSALGKKAVIRCGGNSDAVSGYSGAITCKGAKLIESGFRRCPYSCLGLGDCAGICPQGAISIDNEKHIFIVDHEKCNGCGLCLNECPQNLIELVSVSAKVSFLCNYQPLRDIPGREKCDSGCIHCRKCFKACEDEGINAIAWDKETARPVIDQDKCTLCGRCIAECPQNTLGDLTGIHNKNTSAKIPVAV